jgi:tRNA dimethylallyltransferase
MTEPKRPLLIVLGPTASGKSSLGLELAASLDGEIVSADAFAVYRGLDIGTDTPSIDDRRRVPHHLIDCLEPSEVYSAGLFAEAAREAIADIRSRRRLPLVVGGTHFYIRALLLPLFPSPPRDPQIRSRLAVAWDNDPRQVIHRLEKVDPDAAARIAPGDRQRILRALEVFDLTGEPLTSHWKRQSTAGVFDPLMVAPHRDRSDLYARIDARVDRMFASGLVEEVTAVLASGVPSNAHALKAIGYRDTIELLEGRCDLATAIENTKKASRRFAKRQLTWLRSVREGTVHWVPPVEDGGAAAVTRLWDAHTEERRAT